MMRVAFLYNRSSEDPASDAEDDVPARSPVVAALRRLGHEVRPIACTLDLASVRRRLERARPDVVFNRVESLGGSDAMMAAVPMLLDTLQLPYTGCPTEAMVAATSKVSVKERLVAAGLPTPAWITVGGAIRTGGGDAPARLRGSKFIVKAVYEHASFEMDDDSVTTRAHHDIAQLLLEREAATGRAYFAEEFIDGREFNLSVMGEGPEVLPPAEIDFSTFPAGKPRIVGHRAKCDMTSFEYDNTPRRFDFPATDVPLLDRLRDLARECWKLFGLKGYARVDFRVDQAGQPWILEINTNPCTMPDTGFAAALEQAGIGYDGGLQRIIDDAIARRSGVASSKHRHSAELVV